MGQAQRREERRGMIGAIVSYVIFGLSFLFSRVALTHTSVAVMLVIRFGIAALLLAALAIVRVIHLDFRGKPLLPLIAMGLCQPVLYFFLESYGIQYTNASFSGMMLGIVPVTASLLSAVFLKEAIRARKMFWIVCSVLGVGLASLAESASGSVQPRGILYLCGAVLTASTFSVISRSLADRFTPVERTFVMMTLGFVAFLLFAILQEGRALGTALQEAAGEPGVMIPVLFLGTLSSVLAFFLQNYALSRLSVQQSVTFLSLTPIVSVLAGVLVLGEPFTPLGIAAIVIVLFSVYRANRL